MAGEGDPVNVGGAGVEDVEQEALALPNADGFAGAEHLAVDGGDIVGGGHIAVAAGEEVSRPIVEGEEGFGVVVAGMTGRFNDQRAEEAAVEAFAQVITGAHVGMVPAEAGRVRRERVTDFGIGSDHGRALFHGAVDL